MSSRRTFIKTSCLACAQFAGLTAVLASLRTLRLKQERFDEVFADVRVMERAALAEMNKE